jgi:Tat protein translocase TatB subunit
VRCNIVTGKAGPFSRVLRYHVMYTIMDFGAEMIFFAVLALVLFGPRKLPQIAREVGRFMAEFKRAGNQFQNQMHEEIRNLELEDSVNSVKNISAGAGEIMSTVKDPNPVATALGRLTDRIKNVSQDHDA